MVEWSITPVLKTGVPRGTGGSNPSLSAKLGNMLIISMLPKLFLKSRDDTGTKIAKKSLS